MIPSTVTIHKTVYAKYPNIIPYHPDTKYPEYPFTSISLDEKNYVYQAVRETLILAKLDNDNIGKESWNPLSELLQPGQNVLVKPNFVKEAHPRDPEGWKYIITHGSVIRAVCDYAWLAIGKKGQIIIADAPQTDSSFDKIVALTGLMELKKFYYEYGYNLEIRDLRQQEWTSENGVITKRKQLRGDPEGYILFDLGKYSEFFHSGQEGRFYGADYDRQEVNQHHSGGKHEYLIAGTAIKADAIISIPKMKTHKKAGITISLKNIVGINGDKNYLPHHTEGSPETGGDEFPLRSKKNTLERLIKHICQYAALRLPFLGTKLLKYARYQGTKVFGTSNKTIRNGNWHGNDTVWRMCLDLNKILLYGNMDGTFRPDTDKSKKPYYTFVDGIIAGEGNGPTDPDPVKSGLLLFGIDPAVADAACTSLMGFDPRKIKIACNAFKVKKYAITQQQMETIHIVSNDKSLNKSLKEIEPLFHFMPPLGWAKNVEKSYIIRNHI